MKLSLMTSRALGRSELFFKKNGATILTTAGVAGFAATTVLVGRAVLRSQPVMSDLKKDTDHAIASCELEELTDKEKAQAVGKVWLRQAPQLLKIYGPAISVGSLSIICILASHRMMLKNRAALLAAYTALDTGFRAYRNRVAEEIGFEKEADIHRGIRRVLTDDENIDACIIELTGENVPSPYARFFDESSANWSKTPEYNLLFLRAQQNWANDRLRAHGFVFLNEVLENLGLERSQAGQVVGWKLDGNGDGFVDFGLYDIFDESNRAFVNLLEHTVLLDFNVDGPITI